MPALLDIISLLILLLLLAQFRSPPNFTRANCAGKGSLNLIFLLIITITIQHVIGQVNQFSNSYEKLHIAQKSSEKKQFVHGIAFWGIVPPVTFLPHFAI